MFRHLLAGLWSWLPGIGEWFRDCFPMPESERRNRPDGRSVAASVRRYAALIALALVAAACGDSGATGTTLQTLDSSASETMPPPTTGTAQQQGPESPLPASDYPDVVVADLLAGGDFHLKELALEQNPVLLWFWAPH